MYCSVTMLSDRTVSSASTTTSTTFPIRCDCNLTHLLGHLWHQSILRSRGSIFLVQWTISVSGTFVVTTSTCTLLFIVLLFFALA
jgi:hypothetical protein